MLKPLLSCSLMATTLIAPSAIAQTADEAPAKPTRRIPFNLSLIGPYGFAQVFDEPVVAQSSLNLLGGQIGGIEGLSIGTLYNHVDKTMAGLQMAAGLNLVGRRVVGLQMAGGMNVVDGAVDGVQAAGGLNLAGTVDGVQVAGGYNFATQSMKGVQTAVINQAGDVEGVQVGVFNIAGTVKGVQVGVLNVAEDVDVPIGLFSYVRQGRFEGDLQVTDSGFTTLGVSSGSKRVYSVLGLSNLPKADGNHLGLNVGLGFHFPLSERSFSRLEITGGPLQEDPSSVANWTSVNSYKAMLGWKLAPRLAIKAGVSLNQTTLRKDSTFRPSDNLIYESGRFQVWPAAFLGVDL
ncbi:hypothetical protein D3C86_1112290 [compost metagenome]